MGTHECHVVITELDEETKVQHDNCDIRSNVEQDVNVDIEDETKKVQDQTTCDVTTGVEPEVDQTNVTTGVQDEHASPGKYRDYNADEPLVDPSDHMYFNWEEPNLGMVGEKLATEQPVHQASEYIKCNWDEPKVDNVHSDYGLLDELESLNSDEDADEPRRKVREPIFNAKTDMSDPLFSLAQKEGNRTKLERDSDKDKLITH
ncbi:hypothetical protein Fot_41546 [Forsythia ovata]|uniref:Uncharacterized protein n=1 Tax=Forsythia ovata TaxID=205694 RepID=A0ABD1RIJ6_9LAMI